MKMRYCLFVLMGLAAVLLACADDTPATAVTVVEVCSQESGTKVVADGYLALPSFLTCTYDLCQISFYDETDGVLVELVASDRPFNNNLKLPPESYTADDLNVVLADGTVADRTTGVKITGLVKRPSDNVCYLDAHRVERQ